MHTRRHLLVEGLLGCQGQLEARALHQLGRLLLGHLQQKWLHHRLQQHQDTGGACLVLGSCNLEYDAARQQYCILHMR